MPKTGRIFYKSELKFELLEDRRLLATISWTNNDPLINGFSQEYGPDATLATALVNRAIDDWERVIESFNYDPAENLNDTFELTVSATTLATAQGVAGDFTETANGKPKSGAVLLSANGGGEGWYFDPTPNDDAEFSGLVNERTASFVDIDADQEDRVIDFYQTVLHEIGHTLGFAPTFTVNNVTFPGYSRWDTATANNPQTLIGSDGQVLAQLANGAPSHLDPNTYSDYMMLPSLTLGIPKQTQRFFISDFEATILEDIFDYTINLPSTFDTAYATLDSQTGTLLVQGLPGEVVDDIDVNLINSGNDVEVEVNGTTEVFAVSDVVKIVIAGNGGSDTIDVALALQDISQEVDYVVSSNQDAVDNGTLGDGLVDLDSAISGNQITLRAAVQEANHVGNQAIYVPRGNYDLDLTGSGGDTQGDLDITKDVTVVGAGPGATVITAPTGDRHFEVADTGTLTVERLTLTGSTFTGTGAAIHVAARTSSNTALTLKEVAVVNNEIASAGGALFVDVGAKVKVERSVIANDSASFGGGGIAANASAAGFAEVTLVESIVTNNNSDSNDPDLASASVGGNVGKFISAGHNLFGDVGTADLTPAITDPTSTDYESPTGTVNYVVTSVVDTFDLTHTDDDALLSLREAVNLANENRNVTEEIWLPAWSYALTRQSSVPGAVDDDMAFGDLEITDGLIVRGAGDGVADVRQDVAEYQDDDDTFDLIGDYDDDFDVDYDDFNLWLNEYNNGTYDEAVDGNDDGVIDADDYYTWVQSHTSVLEILL